MFIRNHLICLLHLILLCLLQLHYPLLYFSSSQHSLTPAASASVLSSSTMPQKRMSDSFSICQDMGKDSVKSILAKKFPLSSQEYSSGICDEFFSHCYYDSQLALEDIKMWLISATTTHEKQAVEIVYPIKNMWKFITAN